MQNGLRHFNAWRRLGLLLIAADAWLSLSPSAGGASIIPDKLAHFLVYLAIAFWFSTLYPRAQAWVLAGSLALGGALEILQGLGSARQAEWLDMLANALGAMLGCALARLAPVNVFAWFERLLPEGAR